MNLPSGSLLAAVRRIQFESMIPALRQVADSNSVNSAVLEVLVAGVRPRDEDSLKLPDNRPGALEEAST